MSAWIVNCKTMDQSFFSQIEKLELLGFFSGYPLVYAFTWLLAGSSNGSKLKKWLVPVLPYAYALVGTLYLGLLLKNAYPNYSVETVLGENGISFLRIWGLSTILFWLPVLSRKVIFSLFHSLVFFYLLLKDLFVYLFSKTADKQFIKNDMKVYTDSILLTIVALLLLTAIYWVIDHYRRSSRV